jgi:ABC-type transport system involved in multi-copper enzyme maturation permease subunit
VITAILRKEIIGSGRHGRYFAVRGAYLLLLSCVTIPAIYSQAKTMLETPTFNASNFGKDFTITFGILQFVLVALLAPAFSIGTLAGERATGGLDLLHVAGVRPLQVVLGKYAARLAWVALFLVSGMPLFIAGTLMGGVGLQTVALLMTHGMIAGMVGTALGFTLSGGLRQTVPSLVLSYIGMMGIYAGLPLLLAFYDKLVQGGGVQTSWYAWASPIAAVVQYTEGTLPAETAWKVAIPYAIVAFLVAVPAIAYARPDVSDRVPRVRRALIMALIALAIVHVLVLLGLIHSQAVLVGPYGGTYGGTGHTLSDTSHVWAWFSPFAAALMILQGVLPLTEAWQPLLAQVGLVLLVLLWFLGVRPMKAAAGPQHGRNDPDRRLNGGSHPPEREWKLKVRGNPIAWRDARAARRSLASRVLRWAYLGLATVLIGATVVAATASPGQSSSDDFGKITVFLLVAGGGVVALIVGSGTLAEERERRAMPLLKLSRMTAGDLLLGKAWGLMVYLWPIAVLPVLVAGFFFWKEDPFAVAMTLSLTAVVLFSSAAVGLFFSSFAPKAATAIGVAIAVVLVYSVVPPLIVEFARMHSADDLLTIFNPFATMLNVIDEFGRVYQPRVEKQSFWLSIVGVGFLMTSGVGCMILSWSSLMTREEA